MTTQQAIQQATQRKQYRQLLRGASFYNCGRAANCPDRLIVEPGIICGSDYLWTFHPGTNYNCDLRHPLTVELRNSLVSRNALDLATDRINLAAFTPIFADWCISQKVNVQLDAVIIPDATVNGSYEIYYNNGETDYYQPGATTLLDNATNTTNPTGKKQITAFIIADSASDQLNLTKPTKVADFLVTPAYFAGQYYIELELDDSLDWTAARALFYQSWAKKTDSMSLCKIVLIAPRFYHSTGFDNPLQALDAGLLSQDQ